MEPTVLTLTLAKPSGEVVIRLYRDEAGSWFNDDGGEFVDSDEALLHKDPAYPSDLDLSDLIQDALA